MDGATREDTGSQTREAAGPAGGRPWWLRGVVFAALGALAAGLYAHFIGCRTGTCLLTSNVWTASVYGAVVGGVAGWPPRPREERG